MKKLLILAMSAVMALTMCACGDEDSSSESSNKIVVSDPDSSTLGTILRDDFNKALNENPDMSLQELADSIMSDSIITFQPMTMPVENGLLTGFGNTEITGFKEGIMFGPAISSIPFIGYIFDVAEDTDFVTFMTILNNSADKSWNVCTEADDVIIDSVGTKVFFVMSPNKLEEE